VHAAALDVVDAGIDVYAGAVKLRRMDMDDQRHALGRRDGHAGGKGHPVVGVDDVELFLAADLAGEICVALDFGEKVTAVMIAAGGLGRVHRDRAGD